MNRGELEGKLWFLCGLQDIITDRSVNLGRVIGRIKGPARQELEREMEQAQAKRHEVINEILDAFDEEGPGLSLIFAEHHVQGLETINQTLIRQINDARKAAAAWKQAAKKKRAQAAAFAALLRGRYDLILEARAECTRLWYTRAAQVQWKASAELEQAMDDVGKELEDARAKAKHFLAQFWKMKGERDEATEAACKAVGMAHDARLWTKLWKRAARMHRAIARDCQQQRDEALACCTELAGLAEQLLERSDWWADRTRAKERERDEARAECTRLAENSYAADLHRARVQLRRTYEALDREKHGHMHMVGAYAESQDRLGQALEQRDTLAAELDDARAEIARLSVVVDRLARELGRFGLPYSILIGASKLAKVTGADRETDYERMEQEERQGLRFW